MSHLSIAVISDIHGYSLALDRVLEDIARHNVDHIIVAVDVVEGGPDPVGVMDRLLDMGCVVIQGNTDYDIAKRHRDSRSAAWTERQIGNDGREWLLNLPFEHRITPPGANSPWQDLLVVHANPNDFNRPIEPDASDDDLDMLIGKTKAAVLAFGHIHIAYTRQIGRMQLMDVSAVGNPKDGDLRSKWGLATWDMDDQVWSTELHYVEYPLEETEAQMLASGIPKAEKKIRKLKEARYE
jgi:protein phosphatase